MVFLLKKTLNDYFTQERNKLDHIVALEIGPEHAPILRNLKEYLKGRQIEITYRGMSYYFDLSTYWENADRDGLELMGKDKPEYRPDTTKPFWYRDFAKEKLIKQETNNDGIQSVFFPWDAKDLPYPFEDNYFTEIHNHMITDKIVRTTPEEFQPIRPTIDEYANEINRILKPNGIFFFTNQGHFFNTYNYHKHHREFTEAFKKQGFDIAFISLLDKEVKRGLYHFTHNPVHVNMILLAQKK
ncbi:hypothetical protein AYK26_01175 [Euryarchaeota archaeon SM23-78]|nr:MAG: hypothetical protein AYK26_01175 [Euryarchaeota archaeon SM23-78]MBW3001439.1 hypothetical protein [Candidatus Woesearchaeota archaeon]